MEKMQIPEQQSGRLRAMARYAVRASGAVLSTITIAALPAAWATTAVDTVGFERVTYSPTFSPDHEIDTGALGTVLIKNNSDLPVSIHANVEAVGANDIENPSLKAMANAILIGDTSIAKEYAAAYIDTIKDELEDVYIDRLLAFELAALLAWGLMYQKLRYSNNFTPKQAASTLIAVGLVSSAIIGGAAKAQYDEAAQTSMSSTPLEIEGVDPARTDGISTIGEPLRFISGRGIDTATNLARRQNTRLADGIEHTKMRLQANPNFATGIKHEDMVVVAISDMHCSLFGIETARFIAENYQANLVASAGDNTTNGTDTAPEKACVQLIAHIAKQVVESGGNHDSKATDQQFADAGAIVLDGKTITVNGIRLLGDDDPLRTPPFASGNYIVERPETEQEMGRRLALQALKSEPRFILVHQPSAAAEVVRTLMEVPDVGKSFAPIMVLSGHEHQQKAAVVHQTPNGIVIDLNLGTSGGVGPQTISEISTPFSLPRVDATFTVFRITPEGRMYAQVITAKANGQVEVSAWNNIEGQ